MVWERDLNIEKWIRTIKFNKRYSRWGKLVKCNQNLGTKGRVKCWEYNSYYQKIKRLKWVDWRVKGD